MEWIMDLPQETINLLIGGLITIITATAGIPTLFFRYFMKKSKEEHKESIEQIESKREKEQLESQIEQDKLRNELAEIRKEHSLIEIFAKVVEGLGRMDLASRENTQQLTTAINTMEISTSQKMESLDSTIKRFSNEIGKLTVELKRLPNELNQSHKIEHSKLNEVIDTLLNMAKSANTVIQNIEKTELQLSSKLAVPIDDKVEKGKPNASHSKQST